MFSVTMELDGVQVQISRSEDGDIKILICDGTESAYFTPANAKFIAKAILAAAKE